MKHLTYFALFAIAVPFLWLGARGVTTFADDIRNHRDGIHLSYTRECIAMGGRPVYDGRQYQCLKPLQATK